jgi:DNA-binding beta-propeller fold protein YncE
MTLSRLVAVLMSTALGSAVVTLAVSPAVAADMALPKVIATLPGPDGGWDYITLDADHGRALVARGLGVTVFDLATGKATQILAELKGNHIALPINGGKDLLVTTGSTGEAVIAELATGTICSRVKTGAKPDAVVFDPVSGLVWVMDNKGGGVALVNPVSGALEGSIPVPGALEFAVSDGKGHVYANVEDAGEIVAFDARARKVVGHYKLGACEEPTGLAYDADNGRLFAACANRIAAVVAADIGVLIASLPIGVGPDAAVFDPVSHRVFIPSGRDGKLTVIDADALKVLGTGETRTSARTAAIDVKTGRIYLPSAGMGPPATAGGRPVAVPDSFAVLTVSTR